MKQIWNEQELVQYWSLTYEELELLNTKPQKHHLVFCMKLKYYKYHDPFPEKEKDLSEIPLQYISAQLDISDNIKETMYPALNSLNKSIPDNKKLRLLPNNKNHISLSPLTEQAEPSNINKMKGQIQTVWTMTSLLGILKEADLRIEFTECFKTQLSSERLNRDELQKRLLLAPYGLGTNTGLKRISAGWHGVSYKELLHIRKFHISKTALREAIGKVANAIFKIRNPSIWGEGTTACASDSKKFGSWDQNLMTEWHIRYGGRSVMIYWHVEKNLLAFIPSSSTAHLQKLPV